MDTAEPNATEVLAKVWHEVGLDQPIDIKLDEESQLLPSSFHVGVAAQASVAAAAQAASCIYTSRSGATQSVFVGRHDAERECTGLFKLNGETPDAWEKFSGLYATMDGHVRIHANFAHHRDGILELLGLPGADKAEKDDVVQALSSWRAQDFDDAAAERGLVVAKVRSFEEWDAHAHALQTSAEPLVRIERIDSAKTEQLSPIKENMRPLTDVRVLDLTRILAGPICGRTLAAYGADVMLVNSPNLPNISSIVDTSRGKRSVHLDLKRSDDLARIKQLLRDTHVFVQGYRPGAIAALGLSPRDVAKLRPGIVYVSLSAYGSTGPWAERRGFDSLVQTATGFNHAEAVAANSDKPQSLPVPILDYASGFLMAFGAQAALLRQANEGGSWHVEVSLLQTSNWLRSLGRIDGLQVPRVWLGSHLEPFPCADGLLQGMPHAANFSATPAKWQRASKSPGADAPVW